ncbi:MAG: MgtC/SapB family protein [Fibrobacteria bacterium]
MMSLPDLFLKYAVSLAIGILIGMQREFATGMEARELPAGVRTFALIGIWGCLTAHVAVLTGSPLPLATCLIILGAFLTTVYVIETKGGRTGLTTGVSSVIAFLAGVLAFHDNLALAGALGVVTTLTLSLKLELHAFARNLKRDDIFATLKFALLGVVFLPILPNRSYFPPPFDVINPFEVGVFMVLISAVGFIGYILAKTLGAARGIGLLGLLGGLVSSTAVTFGFTRRSRLEPALSIPLASAILGAWTVMAIRTLVVVAMLDFEIGRRLLPPLAAFATVGLLYGALLYRRNRKPDASQPAPFANPFELGPALRFGMLFMLILTISRSAQFWFGRAGIYFSSIAAGLMDVDAVSFSMAKMNKDALHDPAAAAYAILLAVLSNSLLKGAFALSAGSRELRQAILPGIVAMLGAGGLAVWILSR